MYMHAPICVYTSVCVCVYIYTNTPIYVYIIYINTTVKFLQQQRFKVKLLVLDYEKYKHIINLFSVSTGQFLPSFITMFLLDFKISKSLSYKVRSVLPQSQMT